MKFEFSTTVEHANCHVRTYGNGPIVGEMVNDRPHKHTFLEFHCIFSGEETVYLPEVHREIQLVPGQILLIPKDVYHRSKTNKGSVERLCFNFSVESSERGRPSALERLLDIKEVQMFEDSVANSFAAQCRSLRQQENMPLSGIRQGMLMLSIVLQLCSGQSGAQLSSGQENSRAMRQKWIIDEYIEKHFADSDGIEGLAEELYLSQRQTRTLVRRFLGEDYKSIIIRRRMELAEIYLRDPEKSLEEVAAQVGYRSYSGFQLCFKRYFGITPSERRKQYFESNS